MILTEKENEILNKLKEGIKCHYMEYMGRFNPNPYWFMSDNGRKCTIQIKGLEKKGYIKILSPNPYSRKDDRIKILAEVKQEEKWT